MNTDDLKQLARHADSVSGREPVRLHEVKARVRTTRRRRVMATAAGAVLTLAVGVVVLSPRMFADGPPPTLPPTPSSPTPTKALPSATPTTDGLVHPPKGTKTLSLRQTVLSWNAELLSGVTSPDDPDVRLSIWRTECVVCPEGEAGHPRFAAMALTRDGYRTTTYLHLPTEASTSAMAARRLDAPSISSPAPGVFLLVEHLNGPAWVLHANGDLRAVRIVGETRRMTDRRLVYQCETDVAVGVFSTGWCLLDPRRATAALISGTWIEPGRSVADPGLGQAPWGVLSTIPERTRGQRLVVGPRRAADPGAHPPPGPRLHQVALGQRRPDVLDRAARLTLDADSGRATALRGAGLTRQSAVPARPAPWPARTEARRTSGPRASSGPPTAACSRSVIPSTRRG